MKKYKLTKETKLLIDKKIPKKVIVREVVIGNNPVDVCECPDCGGNLDDIYGVHYCPYCSKALDWSGDE